MGYPVVQFEIIGKNAAGLRTFYRAAFGWKIGASMTGAKGLADYTLVDPESPVGIDGGIGESPAGYAGHVTFYVAVPDVARALESIEQLGGKKMLGPEPVPDGPILGLFEDPEGNVIGLLQSPAR